jgi:hypothetical protein
MKGCGRCLTLKKPEDFYSGKSQCISCVLELRKEARSKWTKEQKRNVVVYTAEWRKRVKNAKKKVKK